MDTFLEKPKFSLFLTIGIVLNLALIGILRFEILQPLTNTESSIGKLTTIHADTMSMGMGIQDLPNCGLSSPAFCDMFDTPHPGGRAGDLDDSKWSYARISEAVNAGQGQLDEYFPADGMFCRTLIPGMLPELDSFFCNANGMEHMHWMTTMMDGGNYTLDAARIRQPFDFTNRTGTISFSVDAVTRGGHSWWPEVVISQDPIPGAHEEKPGEETRPRNGVAIEFSRMCGNGDGVTTDPSQTGVGSIIVFNNYNETNIPVGGPCVNTLRDNANHFQIQISQDSLSIYGSDIGSTTLKLMESDNVNLNFSTGYVYFEQAQYFASKFNGEDSHTYHWHAIGFDGPVLPTPRSYEIPDALTPGRDPGTLNLGYLIPTSAPGKVFNLNNVDLTGATGGQISFDIRQLDPGQTVSYRFNGGTWHNISLPYTPSSLTPPLSTAGFQALFDQFPITDLKQGNNTLEMIGVSNPVVANIDVELTGPSIAITPEPQNPVNVAGYLHIAPSYTDIHQPFIFGQASDIMVTANSNELAAPIKEIGATINVPSNFQIQSVTLGDCNLSFTKTPTTSNPSFTGTVPNDTTMGCTVETISVIPQNTKGTTQEYDTVSITNPSMQTLNNASFLQGTSNATYEVDAPTIYFNSNISPEWPYAAKPGGTLSVAYSVTNETPNTINAIDKYQLYDSNGNLIQTAYPNDGSAIAFDSYGDKGGTITFSIPSTAPLGIYTIVHTIISPDGATVYFSNNNSLTDPITTTGQPAPTPTPTVYPSPSVTVLPSVYPTPPSISMNANMVPADTYNTTMNLSGSSATMIASVDVTNPANNDVVKGTVTNGTSWTISNVFLATGVNALTVNGYDSTGTLVATSYITVNCHAPGNIKGSGVVDLTDLSIMSKDWHRGLAYGNSLYDPMSDLNGDGSVDIKDLSVLAKYWGK